MKNLLKNADPKQRRAAGNIFRFLAFMLIFTLVARGTSGATLAKVTVSAPARSEIIEAINGVATVMPANMIDVTVLEGLTVDEVFIGVGQEVRSGDAIAAFCVDELSVMRIRENARLDQMRFDLERHEHIEPLDASALENARRTLARAREDYTSAVHEGEEDIDAARGALERLLNESGDNQTALRNHARALEDYIAAVEQGRNEIADAQEVLNQLLSAPYEEWDDNAVQSALRSHTRAVEDYEAAVAQGEHGVNEAQEALRQALRLNTPTADRNAIDNARRNYQRTREDFESTRIQGEAAVETALGHLHNALIIYQSLLMQISPDPSVIASAIAEINQRQAAYDSAKAAMQESLFIAMRKLEDAQASLAQAEQNSREGRQSEIERAEAALETAQARAAENKQNAARRLEDAEHNLMQNRQNLIEQAQKALDAAESRARDNLLAATRRLEDTSQSLDTEVERAQAALQTAVTRANDNRRTAARRVEDAAASLASAEFTHQRSVHQRNESTVQSNITAVTLALDIADKEAIVESLDALILAEGILFAEKNGVVATITEKGSVTAKAPFATLRDTEGGFEAQMQVNQRDAQRLSVGSQSEVTTGGGNLFFTPTVTGVVSAISAPDENDRVTVTIALPGNDWGVGQRIDAQIVLSRGNYDMSVPISALRTDNTGYFVYAVGRRNTVLGLQNVVERINVSVIVSDDHTVSVTGPIDRGSQVISSSNRAVSVGDRVRVN
ncbi:MAG: hypothetical protein FWE90_03135 [Defluviitaleaceae bacterium]|nr:hypothetical protein [Defluviitaleaceae bacterium]